MHGKLKTAEEAAKLENEQLRGLRKLSQYFEGEIMLDLTHRHLYATDAGLYRELPLAVAYPKSDKDLKNLILFANEYQSHLIPRTAGTSLGGQCVGSGVVVDVSKYLTQIIELNTEERWVRVRPGVVRDELNHFLKPHNLYFGPNTSTSNRAMIGGMVGNNSSGSYSIKYGTTRENVLEIKGFLSDGSSAVFGALDTESFRKKTHGTSLESAIYRQISFELSHPIMQKSILEHYPKASVTRRNTGYAVDLLLNAEPFHLGNEDFNFCKMLAGSEGTLMLFSEIKLHLHPLPTTDIALICAHFSDLNQCLQSAVEVMKLRPNLCELMDKIILDCTKDNLLQRQNRFFIEGDPAAILMIEVEAKPDSPLEKQLQAMQSVLSAHSAMFAAPTLYGPDISKALQLRASGLGVLQNVRSAEKPLEFVEDTAVDIADLPAYIAEFEQLMKKNQTSSVYYAHAGAGELHLRPKVNLRTKEGIAKFRKIAEESADLVKKYNGSLSGEHGDGRVRSELIPKVLGEKNYQLLQRIKTTWDPKNIFNPGKIVNPFKLDEKLKHFNPDLKEIPSTFMDFSREGSYLSAAEKCSGSGDCRKTEIIGGTLCPSYMASRRELDSTRARANILREMIVYGTENVFESEAAKDVLSLCLGCKACISECPSSVDISSMKSEFLYQYQKKSVPSKLQNTTAKFYEFAKKYQKFSFVLNAGTQWPMFRNLSKKVLGIDSKRSLPKYASTTFEQWLQKNQKYKDHSSNVFLYCDEFTNFLEPDIAIKALKLLYYTKNAVNTIPVVDSARSLISKGYLEEAKVAINSHLDWLRKNLNTQSIIVGIEPSAILGFRDDYSRLVTPQNKDFLEKLKPNVFTIEEYLHQLKENGQLKAEYFTQKKQKISYHGHCHQKALSRNTFALEILAIPENFSVEEIKSGCCGMAGSFGYEHVDMSFKVGELVLFPYIRKMEDTAIVAASGTSCRHQIKDGVQKTSFHPVEILYDSLRPL